MQLEWISGFREQLHDTALRNQELPAKAIAPKLGIEYSHFLRQVSPTDDGAKFDAAMLVPLMYVTNDFRLLHFQAACLSHRVRPLCALPEAEPTPLHRHVSLDEAVTVFKRLDAMGERYEVLIAAMTEIANAAEIVCAMARARDFGKTPEEAMIGRAMFRKQSS